MSADRLAEVAVIVGGGPGVSASCARLFASEGMQVAVAARNPEKEALKQLVDEHGVQCGFCIPGFIMTARAAMNSNSLKQASKIPSVVSGNLCRCTGYVKIFKSIEKALKLENR